MLFQNYFPHKFPLSQRNETNFGHMMIDISLLPSISFTFQGISWEKYKKKFFHMHFNLWKWLRPLDKFESANRSHSKYNYVVLFLRKKKRIHWHLQIGLELTSRLARLLLAINSLGIPTPGKVAPRQIKWNKTRPLYLLKHRQIQSPCAVYLYHTSLSLG